MSKALRRIEKAREGAMRIAVASTREARSDDEQSRVQAIYDRGYLRGLEQAWEIVSEEEGGGE